jgi:hypothetical protein
LFGRDPSGAVDALAPRFTRTPAVKVRAHSHLLGEWKQLPYLTGVARF